MSCSEFLDIGGWVVCELVPLAQPDVALCGVEVGLSASDLVDALDIATVIGFLVVEDLLTACGCLRY